MKCEIYENKECSRECKHSRTCIKRDKKLELEVIDLNMSVRTTMTLLREGITKVKNLKKMSDEDLRKIELLGDFELNEIHKALKRLEENNGNKSLEN